MVTAQEQFRLKMAELDKFRAIESPTPEQAGAFKSALAEAQNLKSRVEDDQAADALKSWANQPDGQSVVKSGWSGEVIGENDGVIHDEIISDHDGYLYAVGRTGEAKLRALKSGAYKDAFVGYLRQQATGKQSYLKGNAFKVLQEGVDESGGFWVPPDMRPELIRKIAAMATIRANARVITTGSDIVSFPKVVYTASNNYTSGVRFDWTAEAPSSDISEATNPAAGRVNIPVHTATAAVILTRAIIEDAQFDVLGYVSQLIGESYALGENNAFISGTGAGQPQGILTHANASVAHTFSTGVGGMYVPSGISGAVSWLGTSVGTSEPQEGYVGVEAALPPQYEDNAKWYMSKLTKASTGGLTDTAGRPLWLRDNQFSNFVNGTRNPPMLLGYPVVVDQFVPAPAADAKSVIFGDMQGYYVVDRVGLSIEVLREIRALKDEVIVYARKRVGGQLVHDWMIKLMKLATS